MEGGGVCFAHCLCGLGPRTADDSDMGLEQVEVVPQPGASWGTVLITISGLAR